MKKPDLKNISKSKIQILESQLKELTEALQRERADAVNLRRRVDEERAAMGDYHKATIVRDLLPVIDNCERLLNHISTISEDSPLKEGAEKIVQQSYKVLADLGVERIKAVGEHFDPRLHEAVHMDEGDGDHEVIIEELQPGYQIGEEIIRHAMVKVKKG